MDQNGHNIREKTLLSNLCQNYSYNQFNFFCFFNIEIYFVQYNQLIIAKKIGGKTAGSAARARLGWGFHVLFGFRTTRPKPSNEHK